MLSARQLLALGIIVALTVPGVALAQMVPGQPGLGSPDMREMMQGKHPQGVMPMAGPRASMATPTMPGQDSFGAIQEIVRILEADPNTDWSKVDLEALRQHLIDMNEVTLKADAAAKQVDGGLEIAITKRPHARGNPTDDPGTCP